MTDPDLMQVFAFSAADLAANATGTLRPGQQARLRAKYATLEQAAFIVALFPGVMVTLGVLTLLLGEVFSEAVLGRLLILLGTLLLALLVGGVFLRWRALQADLQAARAAQLCGRVALHRRLLHYSVMVEGQRLLLTRAEFEALEDQRGYCLYFAPQTRYVLAVRPL